MQPHRFAIWSQSYVPSVISGLLLTVSFPKISWGAVAWIALVPLLWSLRGLSGAAGLKRGFLTGVVHYTTLLYWITNVMKDYGGLSIVVSWSVLFLLVIYLSLYLAIFSWGISLSMATDRRWVWLAPFLWSGLEYAKGNFLTGFPWENLGYAQFDWLHVIQISDICGVYGVSAVIVAVNTGIFRLLEAVHEKNRVPWVSFLGLAVLLMVILGYGTYRIKEIDKEIAGASTERFAVVQGNIDQSQKWLTEFQQETVRRYRGLTETVIDERPDLIIWPETALPFYFLRDRVLTNTVMALIREANTHFILGSPSAEAGEKAVRYYNSAYLIDGSGNILGRYDKAHLVPYGEYVPLKRFFPFLGKIVEAVGDFESGKIGQTLSWKNGKLGVLICFEVIFPELARAMCQNGAEFLINITNDAWFGRSSAPYQHLSMSVFRAIENRRALARAANTGVSAFIDPVGRMLDATPLYEEAVRTEMLPRMDEQTLYTKYGDVFAYVCLIVCVISIPYVYLNRRKK